MGFRWPAGACLLALATTVMAMLGSASSARADETPQLELTTDPPGTVHLLTPGETALWNIRIATRGVSVDALIGALRASGTLLAASSSATIELKSCGTAWTGSVCAAGGTTIMPATALSNLPLPDTELTDGNKPIPRSLYLQTRVTLPSDAGLTVQGTSTDVVLKVTARGSDVDGSHALPGAMADTGSRVLDFGLLGLLAVGAGALVARLASRRFQSDG